MTVKYADGTTVEVQIEREIEMFGERFGVHKHLQVEGYYRMSHIATGKGVPRSSRITLEEAEAAGIKALQEQGEAGVLKAIKKASL